MIPIAKPILGNEEKKAVLDVLSSGMLAQGRKVEEFEEKFSSYIGTKYAIASNNGTTALHTALLASDIKSGDEVITTPFSFIATANSILYCNAKPVFADIEEKTFNIDVEQLKEKITKKSKGVLIVHLYGQPCEMQAINEVCEDYKLKLIEDVCQAHGAEYKSEKIGSFGLSGVFSFYPSKNMTTGEGGMITTNDKKIAERCRIIREHGSETKYYHKILGYNYRMTDISAAIGIEQLKKLDSFNEARIGNAQELTNEIENIDGLSPPHILQNVKHVFNQYTIRVKEFGLTRDQLVEKLDKSGIGTGIYYPIPIHKQEIYKKLNYKDNLLNATKASSEVLSLPTHPAVSKKEINLIISSLRESIE